MGQDLERTGAANDIQKHIGMQELQRNMPQDLEIQGHIALQNLHANMVKTEPTSQAY